MRKRLAFEIILPLFGGCLIYILCRPSTVIVNKWLLSFESISTIKNYLTELRISNWAIYNLPDALWIFGLTNLLLIIWGYSINKNSIIWILMPLVVSFILEFLQLTETVSGTFDTMDLLSYTFGYITPFLIHLKSINLNNYNYEVTN